MAPNFGKSERFVTTPFFDLLTRQIHHMASLFDIRHRDGDTEK